MMWIKNMCVCMACKRVCTVGANDELLLCKYFFVNGFSKGSSSRGFVPMTDPYVCHIWFAIYHQYTPVMLAYIYTIHMDPSWGLLDEEMALAKTTSGIGGWFYTPIGVDSPGVSTVQGSRQGNIRYLRAVATLHPSLIPLNPTVGW